LLIRPRDTREGIVEIEHQHRTRVEPDVGVPDLISRLTDDSKRLVSDEFRLAKLEMRESVHTGAKGALWMGLAFGVGVVAAVGLTIFVAAAIGRIAAGHMWVGALVTGLIELGLAFFLIKKGLVAFKERPYSLPETRAALKDTAAWARAPRAD
jgi:hypothetical protein